MKRAKLLFRNFSSNNISVFLFLLLIILCCYFNLFSSYFESDEWFYFTYYLPLTKTDHGLWKAVLSNFTSADYISGGQHVVPIASAIYFLNTFFFGLNFVPYAFLSLLFHAINSFLVFVLIKILSSKNDLFLKNIHAILGALFFALSPIPMYIIS